MAEAEAKPEYFGVDAHVTALLGRIDESFKRVDGDGFELNLLFLIDDLDRCLPEKGVEMLEAIKLFLEVPGCVRLN